MKHSRSFSFMTQKKTNLQIESFGMTNILLTLRNSKTRDSIECRDGDFQKKNSPNDKRPPEKGVSRWGRGHAPPGNLKTYFENAIFLILRGKSKCFNSSKFKSIFCVKKNNYADNVNTGRDPENRSIYCCE